MEKQILSSLFRNFRTRQIPKSDREEFRTELADINFSRSRILTFILLLGSFLLLITDILNQKSGLWAALPGYKYLFFTHALLALEILSLLPLLYFTRENNPTHTSWRRLFVLLFSYFVTINCALTSASDQMINGEMTVFIMGVLTFAIINYYKPLTSLLMYFCSSAVFEIGITMVQKNETILRSQYINGIIITLLSWVLAVILYYAKVNDFLSKKTIEQQKDKLEQINQDLQSTITRLQESLSALDESQNMIFTLALALESKDTYTHGHSERVADYALELARFLTLGEVDCVNLYRASILHDIGKIGIPDAILNKPGALTKDEWIIMKSHPERGEAICSKLNFAQEILPIMRSHHERYDGTGYPDGLCGEAIPFLARIVSIADSVDAMTSCRSYRFTCTMEQALEELRRCSGKQFDPILAKAFTELYNAKKNLRSRLS